MGPIFWLQVGKKMYEDSPKLLREQAKNLATGIGWFWTVYTALVLYRAGPLGHVGLGSKLFILAPILLLLAAYLLALSSGLPLKVRFDARAPEHVRKTYFQVLRTRYRTLIMAEALLVVAVCVLVLYLFAN